MENREIHIEHIKAYINGELTASDSLFVEQQLASSEQWKDVYEGLLIAEQQQISTSELANQLNKKLITKPRGKTVSIQAWKRWTAVAAACIGILIISYATVYFLSPQAEQQTAVVSTSADGEFSDFNEIEIIEPQLGASPQVASRQASSQAAANEAEEAARKTVAQPTQKITPQQIRIQEVTEIEPQKMNDYLARNGFRQLRFEPTMPTASGKIVQPAMPQQGVDLFEQEQASKYIARFPFTGIVQLTFLVNADGSITDIDVLESPNQEATVAVKDLIRNRTTWQAATTTSGATTAQRLQLTASFGNTVFLEVEG